MYEKGKRVKVNYRGYLADGSQFDTNEGRPPFEFTLGSESVILGFEKAVMEMEIGEQRTVEIPAKYAYGPYLEDGLQSIPVSSLPNGNNLPVGQYIRMRSPKIDQPAYVKVVAVRDGVAHLDFNHRLAGQDLTYWIELVDVMD